MEKVRKPFIYLTIIAVVLGIVGIIMIAGDFTGQAVKSQETTYNLQEVSNHNNPEDCWIIVADSVYDISSGLGGELIELKDSCGKSSQVNNNLQSVIEVYRIGRLG